METHKNVSSFLHELCMCHILYSLVKCNALAAVELQTLSTKLASIRAFADYEVDTFNFHIADKQT